MRRKGYTLIEVMVALVILMLSAEMVILSTLAAVRISSRAERMKGKENGIPVELSLKISEDTEPVKGNGILYRSGAGTDGNGFSAWSIQTELLAPERVEEQE